MTYTLLALLAPGSVEADVGRLQQRIFHEHGLVSAVAVSPLVPVAFLPAATDAVEDARKERRAVLAALNAAVDAPYRISLAGTDWHDGALYLHVDTGGVWPALRAAARSGETPGLFPVHEGFFLGCVEAEAAQRSAIHLSAPPEAFTSSRLAIVQLDAAAEPGAWWRRVFMEILDQVPLRGRRKA